MRREWIEMFPLSAVRPAVQSSPSKRREWIEITNSKQYCLYDIVSLHAEGVD